MIKKGLVVLVVSYFLAFCGSSKDQVYFTGLKDSTIIDSVYWREVIIHKGDQLSITVASLNPEMDQIVNQANSVSGQSGDITPFGRRSDVLLIRQTDSSRLVHRVNLSDPKVIRSSVFQLQSGDLIYVEANQTKKNSSSLTLQLFPVITSGVTLVVALMGIVGRF
jgi:hypothetical protein